MTSQQQLGSSIRESLTSWKPSNLPKEKNSTSASLLLLFDSFQCYVEFTKKVRLNNLTSRPLHFLVYYANSKANQIIWMEYEDNMQFHSVMIKTKWGFNLTSIDQFTHDRNNCFKSWQRATNKFNGSLMKWMGDNFFAMPGTNFNKCKLAFGVPENPPASCRIIDEPTNKQTNYEGFNILLIQTAAKHFNFLLGFLAKNQNETAKFQFNLMTKVLTPNSSEIYFATQPYHFETLVIVVPPGKLYKSFEKLFLSFEAEVWTWIIITFIVAFSTIQDAFSKTY